LVSTEEHETAGAYERPPHVPGKPGWYRTLDEAIHVWALDNNYHGEHPLPEIRVLLGSHIQGWKAQ
jgi:hypothetical protein